jgi:hypothetical protein
MSPSFLNYLIKELMSYPDNIREILGYDKSITQLNTHHYITQSINVRQSMDPNLPCSLCLPICVGKH